MIYLMQDTVLLYTVYEKEGKHYLIYSLLLMGRVICGTVAV